MNCGVNILFKIIKHLALLTNVTFAAFSIFFPLVNSCNCYLYQELTSTHVLITPVIIVVHLRLKNCSENILLSACKIFHESIPSGFQKKIHCVSACFYIKSNICNKVSWSKKNNLFFYDGLMKLLLKHVK